VQEYFIADLPEPHENSPKPDIELDLNYNHLSYKHFDLIFCLEVFDYVWSPVTAFQNIYNLLKPSGRAWVSFPTLYPLHQPVADDALRYMPGGIKKLAQHTGLTIVNMLPRKTETDAIYNAFRIERMRCAKHEDHNISGWIVEFTR
jgi:SAM-dependent methyltransferase